MVIAALVLAPVAGPARGADLDAEILQQAGITPVEYGSGWYLRGDIGWNHAVDGNLTFYSDARYDYDNQKFGEGVSYSLGVGHIFNDWFRADVTLDYSGNNEWSGSTTGTGCGVGFDADCYSVDSATYDRYSLHANAYLNLANWYGISPYVGAGVGLSHVTWNDYASVATCAVDPTETCPYGVHSGSSATEYFSGPTTSYPSADSTVLSYSLMAGVDYRIDERWKLDFGYKWTHLHGGKVVAANVNGPGAPQGDSLVDRLAIHEFRVGLRYEIW
ncbi:MAG: hypothetical protein BroJett030_18750 [Alphaproteobacteria bacterium]|nr:MAG: hypothetical protein BroJett030_18750 [Alphaproteobacteria bacterium]